MLLRALLLSLLLAAAPALRAADFPWNRVAVEPMKTSIYVGSVTLTAGPFVRDGENFSTTYEAKVRPWFFWGESGTITIKVPAAELQKLAQGQRAEFTGEGFNQKHKRRTVTGYAQPADATTGKIKVRITVDGIELIFNGTYRLATE
ncbi:MAG: hypothetical protein HYV95_07565 [Opitutae bacterium]|nr:hypothetical protein [Opitutae bacterium]